jgi:hypothetical protein
MTTTTHKIRWFVLVDPAADEWVPRTSSMRGFWPGYDAECSCGWKSRTGGAIRAEVKRMIDQHRWDAEFDATHIWNGRQWVSS